MNTVSADVKDGSSEFDSPDRTTSLPPPLTPRHFAAEFLDNTRGDLHTARAGARITSTYESVSTESIRRSVENSTAVSGSLSLLIISMSKSECPMLQKEGIGR
jgi:hypothetical protein